MIQGARQEVPPGVISGDIPLAWQALVEDSSCLVMVMDSDGLVHYANNVAAGLLNKPNVANVIGRRLREFTTIPVAEERVSFIRESIAAVQPITVDGMICGYWRRITYRPIPHENGQRPCVLAVGRVASSYLDKARPAGVVRAKHDDTGVLSVLSKREIEILCFIGEGLSASDIARHLHRSVKTVEWHRVALGNKLGIANRVELARIAIRAGLVRADDVTGALISK